MERLANCEGAPPPGPVTAVGVPWSAVVPSPPWPEEFNPQQYAAPVPVSAQAWVPSRAGSGVLPAPREANGPPVAGDGDGCAVVVPSPS